MPDESRPRPRHKASRRWLTAIAVAGLTTLVAVIIISYQSGQPLRRAEQALKSNRPDLALKLIGEFLRDHPDDIQAQALRARALVEIGQLTEALRFFHREGASEPAELHAWAKAHLLRQEWSDAQAVLERLLQLNPNDADALHEITACQSFLGQYRQALESGRRLVRQKGHEARGWLQIGTLHENLGNHRSAIEAWDQVLSYEPDAQRLQVTAAEFLSEFGRVLLKEGQPQRARDLLDRSLALQASAETLFYLGNAEQQLGHETTAVEYWTRAVQKDMSFRDAREQLAQAAYRAKDFKQARDWLEPALASQKSRSSATYLMQRICQALGQPEESKAWQQRTEELRKKEKLQSAINHTLIESPESFWARAIRAYQFAESGNWHQAEIMTRELLAETQSEPFIRELSLCIRNHGPLPSLELIPVHQF